MEAIVLPQWNFGIPVIKDSDLFRSSINDCMVRDSFEAFDLLIWKGGKLQGNRVMSQVNQFDGFWGSAGYYWEGIWKSLDFPDFSSRRNILDFILLNVDFFHFLKTPQQDFKLVEGLQSKGFVLAFVIPNFLKGKWKYSRDDFIVGNWVHSHELVHGKNCQ